MKEMKNLTGLTNAKCFINNQINLEFTVLIHSIYGFACRHSVSMHFTSLVELRSPMEKENPKK